jgi:hypothetical protein
MPIDVTAECFALTRSYAACFYLLALVVGLLALAAWLLRLPPARGAEGQPLLSSS